MAGAGSGACTLAGAASALRATLVAGISARASATFTGSATGSGALAIEEVTSTFAGGRRTLASAGWAPIDQRIADGVVVAATGRMPESWTGWPAVATGRGGAIGVVVGIGA